MKQEITGRIERIRKGEVPEGYKETKRGIIPEDWDVKELNQISTITRLAGYEYSSIWKETKNGEIIALRGFNIGKNQIIEKDFARISNDLSLKLNRSRLYKNDVIYPCVGTIGNAVVIEENDKYHIQQNIAKISPNIAKLNPKYLAYYLMSDLGLKEIDKFNGSSSQPNILVGSIRKYSIGIPSNPEQEKIAEILSTWDKAIELKEKLIEEKKEFKRGLIQKLLVGKIRFKEYVKNPNLQEVRRYSTLPEDWSIKKASSIFSNISKKNNDNEKLLSATQDNGVIPRDMLDGDVMSPSGDTNSYKLVEEGDFVISLRTFQGGIEYSCYRGIISPAYTVIKNKIPICADFYRYIFKSKLFIDRLASSVIGIRDGKQISYGDFSFMFLPYPELKEQEKIAFSLKNLDDNIELLELELNHLKEQKKGLMQLLLTGIVRVEVN